MLLVNGVNQLFAQRKFGTDTAYTPTLKTFHNYQIRNMLLFTTLTHTAFPSLCPCHCNLVCHGYSHIYNHQFSEASFTFVKRTFSLIRLCQQCSRCNYAQHQHATITRLQNHNPQRVCRKGDTFPFACIYFFLVKSSCMGPLLDIMVEYKVFIILCLLIWGNNSLSK